METALLLSDSGMFLKGTCVEGLAPAWHCWEEVQILRGEAW